MPGVVSIDGQITPLALARVSVLDRGFLYGDAVFEALRTYGGVPHALDAHLDRLLRSCAIVGIEPGSLRARLTVEVAAALAECGAGEHYIRIVVTRGQGVFGLSPRGAEGSLRVVLVLPLPEPSPEAGARGLRVESVTAPPSRFLAGAKPAGYLTNLLALEHAQRLGADDALLLGEAGELLEGATSSVFVVRGGRVETPTLALGILPGITRDLTLSLARSLGLPVRECLLTIQDAYRADEVFVTSSVRKLVPVVVVDGVRIGQGHPGPVTRRLVAGYAAMIHTP